MDQSGVAAAADVTAVYASQIFINPLALSPQPRAS